MFWKLLYHCITRFLGHTFVCKFVIQTCSSLEERDKTKAFEQPDMTLTTSARACMLPLPLHRGRTVVPLRGWSCHAQSGQPEVCLESSREIPAHPVGDKQVSVSKTPCSKLQRWWLGKELEARGRGVGEALHGALMPGLHSDCLWELGSLEFKGMI